MARRVLAFVFAFLLLSACRMNLWEADTPPSVTARVPVVAPAAPQAPKPKVASTGVGVLATAWADRECTTALDDADRQKNRQAEGRAFNAPIGQKVTWSNPDNGHAGSVVATQDSYDNAGAYCRTFSQTLSVEGRGRQGTCMACQQPDGSWKVVK